MSQITEPNIITKSILFTDSLITNGLFVGEFHDGFFTFPYKNVHLIVYDGYSCSCVGRHPLYDSISIREHLALVNAPNLECSDLNNMEKQNINRIILFFCNKEFLDEKGRYLLHRALYESEFGGQREVMYKIYFDRDQINGYEILKKVYK